MEEHIKQMWMIEKVNGKGHMISSDEVITFDKMVIKDKGYLLMEDGKELCMLDKFSNYITNLDKFKDTEIVEEKKEGEVSKAYR